MSTTDINPKKWHNQFDWSTAVSEYWRSCSLTDWKINVSIVHSSSVAKAKSSNAHLLSARRRLWTTKQPFVFTGESGEEGATRDQVVFPRANAASPFMPINLIYFRIVSYFEYVTAVFNAIRRGLFSTLTVTTNPYYVIRVIIEKRRTQ